MSTFSISGLSSGLDTKSIIDQLISIDSRPKTKLQWSQQLATTRQSIWNDLKTRLGAMKTAADALNQVETWQLGASSGGTGAWAATSGDPSRLSATTTGTPTAGTYNVAVQTLAQAEISKSTGNLGSPTSGVRETGTFYRGLNSTAIATTRLNALKTQSNGGAAAPTGSVITMNYTVNGAAQSATFNVTSTSTLDNLRTWAQTTIGNGATATLNNGKIEIQTAPGTNNEITALSFSATSGGSAVTAFNSSVGASTSAPKTPATNGGVTAAQTMTITQGGNSWNINLAVGDQISDIVSKINAVSGIGVIATVNGGALQVQSKTTGAASAFNITSSGSAASMLNFQETQTAQDLNYTVDGTSYSSTKNTGVTGAITDVSLNFSGVTSTTLTVGQGTPGATPEKAREDAIIAKVNAFVSAYNSVLDFVNQKTQLESRVTTPADKKNGLTMSEFLAGPMARNYDMQKVSYKLQDQMTNGVSGMAAGADILASVGISTKFAAASAGGSGKLTVDETKLRAAIQADPSVVQNLFGADGGSTSATSGDGFMRRVSKLSNDMVAYNNTPGGSTGIVGGAIGAQGDAIKRLQSSIDRASDSLDRKRAYYERMYSSMETMLGKLQSQGSWLSSQISGMQNSRN